MDFTGFTDEELREQIVAYGAISDRRAADYVTLLKTEADRRFVKGYTTTEAELEAIEVLVRDSNVALFTTMEPIVKRLRAEGAAPDANEEALKKANAAALRAVYRQVKD